jgi:hypothetical protein
LNINAATVPDLLKIPQIGQASAREIIKLREDSDGCIKMEDFTLLKCYKKNPVIMESFVFGPPSEHQLVDLDAVLPSSPIDNAETQPSADGQQPADSRSADYQLVQIGDHQELVHNMDLRNTVRQHMGTGEDISLQHDDNFQLLIDRLMEERLRDKEEINFLIKKREEDHSTFVRQMDDMNKLFQQQREEDAMIYTFRRKANEDRWQLEKDMQQFKYQYKTIGAGLSLPDGKDS